MSVGIKLLVLGSNGFIGKNAVEYYSAKGYEVYSPKRHELNLLDTCAVEKYLANLYPDVVLMSAVNINSLNENLILYFNLARCSHLYGRMITIGSGAEYDMKNYEPMMSEEYFGKHIPSDTYGLSKFVISNDVEKFSNNIVNLRVFGIFGKYEDYSRRFISNNICRILSGLEVSINQDMFFDYLYVDDFLLAAEIFFKSEFVYRNYNICSGYSISLFKLAEIINEVGNTDSAVFVKQEGSRGEYSGNNSRYVSEFGPLEITPFKDSISNLYKWYEKHPQKNQICQKIIEMEQLK